MAGVTIASWLSALQALLPPGRALPREPGARFTKLLEAIAAQFTRAQLSFEALLEEWDPRRATTMLPDWERFLGLPDDCMADLLLTEQERQLVAFARLTEQGGQSKPYYIELAAHYGEPGVKIFDGFREMTCNDTCNDALYSEGDRFVWEVRFNHPAENAREMTCNDTCNDALQFFSRSLAECPLSERKPGHTILIFSYQAAADELLAAISQFANFDTLVLDF